MKRLVAALLFAGLAAPGWVSIGWAQVTVPSAVSPVPAPSPSPLQGLNNVLHNSYTGRDQQGQTPPPNPNPVTLPTAVPHQAILPGR